MVENTNISKMLLKYSTVGATETMAAAKKIKTSIKNIGVQARVTERRLNAMITQMIRGNKVRLLDMSAMGGRGVLTSSENMRRFTRATNTASLATAKFHKQFKPFAFQAWMLSLMFAGMAIQKLMTSIARSTTTAFQDIAHSVDDNITNIDVLSGWWQYLKITIGSVINDVLGPMIPRLVEIVTNIANWVETHPSVVKWGAAVGAAGAALMVFGMAGLGVMPFVNGFIHVINWFGGGKMLKAISSWKNLKTAMAAMKGLTFLKMGLWALIGLMIIAIIIAVKKLWDEFYVGQGVFAWLLDLGKLFGRGMMNIFHNIGRISKVTMSNFKRGWGLALGWVTNKMMSLLLRKHIHVPHWLANMNSALTNMAETDISKFVPENLYKTEFDVPEWLRTTKERQTIADILSSTKSSGGNTLYEQLAAGKGMSMNEPPAPTVTNVYINASNSNLDELKAEFERYATLE